MIEGARIGGIQYRGGRSGAEPIEHDRHTAHARCQDRPRHRGEFEPAEAAQHIKRVAGLGPVPCDRRGDDLPLLFERGADDAGTRAGPYRRVAAEQRHAQGRRDGRVGDPHLADRQRINARLDRHHAVGDRAGAFLFTHRRPFDDIAGRRLEVHLVDPQIGVEGAAQLVDRGAADDEVLHHLRGDRGRIGRDAARRDTVIAGKDDCARMIERGRVAPLPDRQPDGQFLEPAERARRFCQVLLAQSRSGAGVEIGSRQMRHQRADLLETYGGETYGGLGHAGAPFNSGDPGEIIHQTQQ